jgi:hypothetical protein
MFQPVHITDTMHSFRQPMMLGRIAHVNLTLGQHILCMEFSKHRRLQLLLRATSNGYLWPQTDATRGCKTNLNLQQCCQPGNRYTRGHKHYSGVPIIRAVPHPNSCGSLQGGGGSEEDVAGIEVEHVIVDLERLLQEHPCREGKVVRPRVTVPCSWKGGCDGSAQSCCHCSGCWLPPWAHGASSHQALLVMCWNPF